MHHEELSARERAALFALLAAARKLSNSELEARIGIRLEGKERRKLNDLKLVESEKPGREFVHELSDGGWRWCADEFATGLVGRGTILERSLYQVLGKFEQCMVAEKMSLADVMTLDTKTLPKGRHKRRDVIAEGLGAKGLGEGHGDLAARIATAYRALAPYPSAFVKLRDLREQLADIPRPTLDAALGTMFAVRQVNLVPQSNQQALTDAERAAALRVGGEHKHLISIE